jgi:hypothetical protein
MPYQAPAHIQLIQLGTRREAAETSFRAVLSDQGLPYHSTWLLCQSTTNAGTFRFIPDLSIHLVFDLSGLLDIEPFIISTGTTLLDLPLPAGTRLLGMQFAVWEALPLSEGLHPDAPTYAVRFDLDWAHYLYFTLLDTYRANLPLTETPQILSRFLHSIDRSLRKDFSKHFYRIANEPEDGAIEGYSERHQRRLYQECTGISPVQFRRIARFQQTIQRILAERKLSWDGYYDQAHCTHEFKQLCGMTPANILKYY